MRILITGAGGASGISVWKSLKHLDVLMADKDPCASGLYLVAPDKRVIIPRGDAVDFVPFVLEQCRNHRIEMIISTVDAELLPLAAAEKQFRAMGVQIPLSDPNVLQLCRDKYQLLSYCHSMLPTGNVRLFTPTLELTAADLPLFVKPRCGAGSFGVQHITSLADLSQVPCDGSYVVQDHLPGEEYSVDIYISQDGKPVAAVPRLRMKIDSGIAVAARTCHEPTLAKLAIQIGLTVGIRFVANVQFKQDAHGTYHLLEINPRFPGTLPLTAAAGVDIPKLLMLDLNHQLEIPDGLMPYHERMVVRYLTEQYIDLSDWKALL